jgi:hypothetical protein
LNSGEKFRRFAIGRKASHQSRFHLTTPSEN